MLDRKFGTTGAGLTIGLLMILFAALEVQKGFQKLSAPSRLIPLGGLVTGFFGGLLSAQQFIATGVLIAVLVDLSRMATYAASFAAAGLDPSGREGLLVAVATISAFAGVVLSTRYVGKVTIEAVRRTVAALMLLIGTALVAGVIG